VGDEGLSGVSVLIRLWEQSGRRLRERCHGLTDEEFFWEPVADCWNIRPDEQHVGGWSYEYEFAPADPAPLTTIGWRLVHLNAGNRLYWNHAFGDATLSFPDLRLAVDPADLVFHDRSIVYGVDSLPVLLR
jgi:hypothetical protein